MGLGRNIKRQLKVFKLALIIYLDYKAVQRVVKWTSAERRDKLWDNVHRRNAKRVLKVIMEMEGLWVKLGQYLSARADVLPEPYIECLKQLQDSLPARPLSEVYRTIEMELGKPVNYLFKKFDEIPLATASIAQVHRACAKDGVDVVVKVQHEGIKEIILQDLKSAKTVVEWVAWAEPQHNFGPVIDEWCAEVPKELDFNREADNTRTVSKNLGHQNDGIYTFPGSYQVDVLVPEVIQSTEKVIVLQYMDGVRLSDLVALDELGVDKQVLVEAITCAYAHQIYIDGFFNGDPHPGNFLVSKEPPFRPILLDFGLTKALTIAMKQAFAKMLLACAEGDYAALLSAFNEMGLRFNLDMPEEAMAGDMKAWAKEREEHMRKVQKKMKQGGDGKNLHRNPVDAFPSDAVFFMRVLSLLRGLSSMLGTRVVYLDVMRPFAEATLWSENVPRSLYSENSEWVYATPLHSGIERKLRELLIDLGKQQKVLGIQVCAYKDGKVIVDLAAGVLGKYDPRPVQPDSLFPVFSVTKGVTSGLLHWLIDQGKLNLHDKVASLWHGFAVNGKEECTVAHVLNHTAGLHNVLSDVLREDPFLMCNWDDMLNQMADATPESPPGFHQVYHTLTYGWLCGGIIEKATGKKFQDLLEEAFVHPLGVEGEFYIGIPPGVESRLASLTIDVDEIRPVIPFTQTEESLESDKTELNQMGDAKSIPSRAPKSVFSGDIISVIASLPLLFNILFIRRAIIPAANGHFSARALARFYAMLSSGGIVPPAPSSSEPTLGSHSHIPSFSSKKLGQSEKRRWRKKRTKDEHISECNGTSIDLKTLQNGTIASCKKIFNCPKIHDKIMGSGEYSGFTHNGPFGLGFRRHSSKDQNGQQFIAFGHSGVGGSTGLCYPEQNFALAITLNKMSRQVTAKIVRLICSELDLPCPDDYSEVGTSGPDTGLHLKTPLS
eukprot:c26558_g1_i2 orf=399-3233(+)